MYRLDYYELTMFASSDKAIALAQYLITVDS